MSLFIAGDRGFGDLAQALLSTQTLVDLCIENVEDGPRSARFQTVDDITSVNEPIHEFARVIDSLTPETREMWNGLTERTFHVIARSGSEVPSLEIAFDYETVAKIARLGGRVLMKVYPPRKVSK